jgi:hypothetical protein
MELECLDDDEHCNILQHLNWWSWVGTCKSFCPSRLLILVSLSIEWWSLQFHEHIVSMTFFCDFWCCWIGDHWSKERGFTWQFPKAVCYSDAYMSFWVLATWRLFRQKSHHAWRCSFGMDIDKSKCDVHLKWIKIDVNKILN